MIFFFQLRIVLYSIRGMFSLFLWMLNANPVFLLLLNWTDSSIIKGNGNYLVDNFVLRFLLMSCIKYFFVF